MDTEKRDRLLLALLSTVPLLLLLCFDYLPMVDLPEHAAQVQTWINLSRPDFPFRDLLTVNWFTPYLLSYCLVRGLMLMLPLMLAIKVILIAALCATQILSLRLLRGGEPSLVLLGTIALFGANFYWGLFPFLCAVPLGLALILCAMHHAERPTLRSALGLGLLSLLCFFGHLLVLALCGPIAALCILLPVATRPGADIGPPAATSPDLHTQGPGIGPPGATTPDLHTQGPGIGPPGTPPPELHTPDDLHAAPPGPALRARLVRLLPLLSAAPLCLLWLSRVASEERSGRPTDWGLGPGRLADLSWALFGLRLDTPLRDGIWWAQLALLALLAIAFFTLRPRLRPLTQGSAPLLMMVLSYLLLPLAFLGHTLFYVRATAFLWPLCGLGLLATATGRRLRAARLLSIVVACGFSTTLMVRFYRFDRQARDFDQLLSRMEPGRRALSIIFEPQSRHVPELPYLHIGALYQARRGGLTDYSFCTYYNTLVRYRPGAVRLLPYDFELNPHRFTLADFPGYDYYIVRGPERLVPADLLRRGSAVRLVAQVGRFWLFSHR